MRPYPYILTILLCFSTIIHADVREWTSADDPTKKINAEFRGLEGNMVLLKMPTGKLIKFELSKLSKKDQHFARTGEEPKPPEKPKGPESSPAEVMEAFAFGEDPDEVYVRLKNNAGLRGGVNEILRGRTGLNGMYFIKPGGVRYPLFFDFGEDADGLLEVSLQSDGFTEEQYDTDLKNSWETLHASLDDKYGDPALKGNFPPKSTITAGLSMSTHLWQTDKGQIYLGIGNVDGTYSCVVKVRKEGFLAPR